MFYQLPPVGNRVCLSRGETGESLLWDIFHPYDPQYYASGTAALAASISAAIKLKAVADPEVILPAYGCPDLVSAALFSGAKPVLVDLEPDRPWMDLDQVSGNTNAKTVAIIAASLCGIPERMDALRQVAETCSALLIEDSAQAFPCSTDQSFWQGDLVVLSFGRGKPVSMLGGGAVLYRDSRIGGLLPVPDSQGSNASVIFRLQAMLYNRMLSPRLYWLPQSLPFLHLGETRFHSLDQVTPMDEARVALLPANIEAYRGRPDTARAAVAGLAAIAVSAGEGAVDLPAACGMPQTRRLLRYPLLFDRTVRDRVYAKLRQRGLGGSIMYPVILPEVAGLGALFADSGEFPAARSFAARLLTLPLYERLRAADLAGIRACITWAAST